MIRIQRRRTRGWRMPEGAVYVGRPSRWGNPFTLGSSSSVLAHDGWLIRSDGARQDVVDAFGLYVQRWAENDGSGSLSDWLAPLRDATALCCWCPLDAPCHADVLIELLAVAP